MNARIFQLAKALNKRALLITHKPDIFYLTGIELDGFWLVVTPATCAAVVSPMLAGHLRSMKPGFPVIESDNIVESVAAYCRAHHAAALVVDSAITTLALARRLQKHIPIIEEPSPVEALRLVKGKAEIAATRVACQIAVDAYAYARRLCKPGVSEIEIYYKIESYFASRAVKASFPTIVAFGPHAANPHHVPGSRKLRKNDTVLFDLGCVWKGYYSDLTRTFFLGRITRLQSRVFLCVKRAQQAALDAVCRGVCAYTIDEAARGLITREGYGPQFIHTTGHGVGIDIHEAPRISAKDKTVLRAGMIITVEPGVYLPGKFGVRIEDTVLVTHNGCEILTREK